MEVRLDGRRDLVTGANSGIGEAIAIALGEAGARVCVNYVVRPDAGRQVVDRLKRAGTDALGLQADVSDPAQVSQMFTAVDKAWGWPGHSREQCRDRRRAGPRVGGPIRRMAEGR